MSGLNKDLGLRGNVMLIMQQAHHEKGEAIEEKLADFSKADDKLRQEMQVEIQMMVGDLSNLYQTMTNIEKSFKDAMAAAARNTG